MRARKIRRSSGFTLVEILVATAIFAVIMVAALMMYDRNQQVFKQSVEAADLQQNTRVAFDKMVAEVRMAGFDYDRDGTPSKGGEFEQPDEQIEYANTSAFTVRANFDYDANQTGDADNGRETGLESVQFPVVTTGNDEIVTYALRSKNGSNSDSVSLILDLSKPRQAYPGGVAEVTRTIDNVDLSNANPPYELQRITIDPTDNTKFVRTTVADNIRSLKFQYYTDSLGTAAREVTTMPLGTDDNRNVRAAIRSVRVELIGMNAVADAAFTNTAETDTSVIAAKNFRTYKLESLLVPRNLGLKGLIEQEAQPPGAPTINQVCTGACGLAWVKWTAPTSGPPVTSYTITWDTNKSGSYASIVPLGNVLNGWAGILDPTKAYFFKVKSLNGYGNNASGAYPTGTTGIFPTNKTKPEAPKTPTAASAASGDEITLAWVAPSENVSGSYGPFGGATACTTPPDALPPAKLPSLAEESNYAVYRSSSSGFVPTDAGIGANRIWTGSLTTGVLERDVSGNVIFHDVTPVTPPIGVTPPPAKFNCQQYYYRVKAVETCASTPPGTANDNDPVAAISAASIEFFPTKGAQPKAPPVAPTNLIVDPSSGCGSLTCDVTLKWDAVTQNTAAPPDKILVSQYSLQREQWLGGVKQSTTSVTVNVTSPPASCLAGAVAGPCVTDTTLPKFDATGINRYQYRYVVQAVEPGCDATSVSAFSTPPQIFPCANFNVVPPGSGFLGGAGTQTSPYIITSPIGTFKVAGQSAIDAVTATITDLTTGKTTALTATPVGTPPTKDWTINTTLSGNDGRVYRLNVTITDNTNGCTTTNSPGTFIEDAPSSCCLEPFKLAAGSVFNAAVLTIDTATDTANVKLVNDCDGDLTITKVTVGFTDDKGKPANRLQLKRVDFNSPAGLGQQDFGGNSQFPVVTLPGTAALPSTPVGVRTIRGSLANKPYTIGLVFTGRNVVLADIFEVCIEYTDPSGTPFQCRIAPQASATASCLP